MATRRRALIRWGRSLAGPALSLLLACSSSGSRGGSTTTSGSAGHGGASTTGPGSTSGVGGAAGGAGKANFTELGVCGRRGRATVDSTATFDGYEEFYLIGGEGFGDELCVVRFDVVRAGEAPDGCDAAAGQQDQCSWTHRVRYTNASVKVDVAGACADSELALDAEEIAGIEGSEVAYGFVYEYQGHSSVLMQLVDQTWRPAGNAVWDSEGLMFRFDRREGYCGYSRTDD